MTPEGVAAAGRPGVHVEAGNTVKPEGVAAVRLCSSRQTRREGH